jgi:hypothetical protein
MKMARQTPATATALVRHQRQLRQQTKHVDTTPQHEHNDEHNARRQTPATATALVRHQRQLRQQTKHVDTTPQHEHNDEHAHSATDSSPAHTAATCHLELFVSPRNEHVKNDSTSFPISGKRQ